MLVRYAVKEGDRVADCGSGTGTTALMAADKAGPSGHVTLLDVSPGMLSVAREKAAKIGLLNRLDFMTGDMDQLPFDNDSFDVALSTYSLCPLYAPSKGAMELLRVVRPGGLIGVAHSTTPRNPVVRWLGDKIENFAWRFPWLSMGCRAVDVLPTLESAGAKVIFEKRIGVPFWPFLVFVVQKPKG